MNFTAYCSNSSGAINREEFFEQWQVEGNYFSLSSLANKYINQTGAMIQRETKRVTSEAQLKEVYRKARDSYAEGLATLNGLKLTPEERYGISCLRVYFKEAIRGMEAGMSGKYEKSGRILAIAESYNEKIRVMVASKVVRK